MNEKQIKKSYTITCGSDFRDSVLKMAENRSVNAADLARSVALVVPKSAINAFPDPGEPLSTDRETVILKSGKSKGRPWQRKPRLQVRMASGYDVVFLRRVLAVAIALDQNRAQLHIEAPEHGLEPQAKYIEAQREQAFKEAETLRNVVSTLVFEPLADGIESIDDAAYIFGFPHGKVPNRATIRARYRNLASVLHPDSGYGSHDHMSQLNAAMDLLRHL